MYKLGGLSQGSLFLFVYRCPIALAYLLNRSSFELICKSIFVTCFHFGRINTTAWNCWIIEYIGLIHSHQQLVICLVDFIHSQWMLSSISSWFQFALSWWLIVLNTFYVLIGYSDRFLFEVSIDFYSLKKLCCLSFDWVVGVVYIFWL